MGYFYEKYIPYIFDNDGCRGTDQFFDDMYYYPRTKYEKELYTKPALVLEVLHPALTNFKVLLSNYTVYQLSNALEYIFNPSLGTYGIVFQDESLDKGKRVETLQALSDFILYIYEDTAEPVLGHLSEVPKNKKNNHLNGTCYMFWDTACIPYEGAKDITEACLAVMGKCARSKNLAVVEGALHGLGHAWPSYEYPIIQKYIDLANIGHGPKSSALRAYAQNARIGYVL